MGGGAVGREEGERLPKISQQGWLCPQILFFRSWSVVFCHSRCSVLRVRRCELSGLRPMPGSVITRASLSWLPNFLFFLLHAVLKFCVSGHWLHWLYQPSPHPSSRETLFLFLKKFYGLGGTNLAPHRALRGRSKKENNPVYLVFPACPKHPSIADIDKISSKALVNQATGF